MKWCILATLDILISLLACPLAPIIALCGGGRWAWPWLTYDNPIDGDSGHWERWPDNGTRLRVLARRTAWLWRNKGYNFSYYILGVVPKGRIKMYGNPLFWKQPHPRGWCFAKCDNAWMLFAWFPYTLFNQERGLRIYLGWKLRQHCEQEGCTEKAMLTTHINPLKGKI